MDCGEFKETINGIHRLLDLSRKFSDKQVQHRISFIAKYTVHLQSDFTVQYSIVSDELQHAFIMQCTVILIYYYFTVNGLV